jgi:hypothetical protein
LKPRTVTMDNSETFSNLPGRVRAFLGLIGCRRCRAPSQ